MAKIKTEVRMMVSGTYEVRHVLTGALKIRSLSRDREPTYFLGGRKGYGLHHVDTRS